MIYDLVNKFGKYFQDDKVILDSYKLDDGYYYMFDENNKFKMTEVLNGKLDNNEIEEKGLKIKDFYSKYINSNKYIGSNKIFSNNIYTLFFKNQSVQGMCNETKLKNPVSQDDFKKLIERYYDFLSKLGNDKKEKELIEEKYTEDEIKIYKEKMLNAFDKVYNDFKDSEKSKNVKKVKIFIDVDNEKYKNASKKYMKVKLFNKNDYNVESDGKIFGANNYNYGLNEGKPFLELKSTSYKIGSRVSEEDIDTINKMYIWLYNNAVGKGLLKLSLDYKFRGIIENDNEIKDKNIYTIKVVGNKGNARIDDFKYTSKYNTKIREFVYKDYLNDGTEIDRKYNIYDLSNLTSNIWFAEGDNIKENFIKKAYFDYDTYIKSCELASWKKDILNEYKDIFEELFEEEKSKNFKRNLDEISIKIVSKMIIDNLEKDKKYLNNPRKAFNLWIAYKIYFSEKGEKIEMELESNREQCKEIVLEKGIIKTDEQFFYLVGQVIYYLLSQSQSSNMAQNEVNPFLNVNKSDQLIGKLMVLYKKYNYALLITNSRFKDVLEKILGYKVKGDNKVNKKELLAGFLANNLFYEKNEKEKINNGGNEDGENEE